MMNPNDEIRRQILRYFYDRNSAATSRFGKKGSAITISVVKKDLKDRHGLKPTQVISNLNYLIDRGWVNSFAVEKTVKVRGGTIPSTVTWYEVASPGIDRIEGGSDFERKERYAGINITATGSNIVTLGDGNLVNAQFSELHTELTELKTAIAQSETLTDTEKLDLAVDIESIKDQLAKEEPNKSIVKTLWAGIKTAATAGGFIGAVERVRSLIESLLGT